MNFGWREESLSVGVFVRINQKHMLLATAEKSIDADRLRLRIAGGQNGRGIVGRDG